MDTVLMDEPLIKPFFFTDLPLELLLSEQDIETLPDMDDLEQA